MKAFFKCFLFVLFKLLIDEKITYVGKNLVPIKDCYKIFKFIQFSVP